MTRALLFLAVAITGCGPAVCPVAATRCMADGERVEVCDGRGQWRAVADCTEVARTSGGAWSCGWTREDGTETAACMPVEEP